MCSKTADFWMIAHIVSCPRLNWAHNPSKRAVELLKTQSLQVGKEFAQHYAKTQREKGYVKFLAPTGFRYHRVSGSRN